MKSNLITAVYARQEKAVTGTLVCGMAIAAVAAIWVCQIAMAIK